MGQKVNRIEAELPYPPSVNHYWRRVGPQTLISKEGLRYREQVAGAIRGQPKLQGPLLLAVDVYPPDRRRRDLDNLFKPLLDALTHANAYDDDVQVKRIEAEMREPMAPAGLLYLKISERDNKTQSPTQGTLL